VHLVLYFLKLRSRLHLLVIIQFLCRLKLLLQSCRLLCGVHGMLLLELLELLKFLLFFL